MTMAFGPHFVLLLVCCFLLSQRVPAAGLLGPPLEGTPSPALQPSPLPLGPPLGPPLEGTPSCSLAKEDNDTLSEVFRIWNLNDTQPQRNNVGGKVIMECSCPGTSNPTCRISNLTITNFKIGKLIPPEFFSLNKLVYLDLSNNLLEGSLKGISNLTNLQFLRLNSNHFTDISDVADLTALESLWAFANNITGNLSLIGQLKNLTDLRIYGVPVGSAIPHEFTNLTSLETLILGNFSGAGDFLGGIANISKLSTLVLRDCNISGELPNLENLQKLRYLDLSYNNFTGSNSSWLNESQAIQYLYIGNNSISVLPDIINQRNMTAVDISNNPMNGILSSKYNQAGLRINFLGTFVSSSYDNDVFESSISLGCLKYDQQRCPAALTPSNGSFAINCGGEAVDMFIADNVTLQAADFYDYGMWVVAASGSDPDLDFTGDHIATTERNITGVQSYPPHIYQSARISNSSLRYYLVGLKNGVHTVELHFAEIVIMNSGSRVFDIIIQGKNYFPNFDIVAAAAGQQPFVAVIKNVIVNVTDSVLDILFKWNGLGTCCVPFNGTNGPLVSAIHVYPGYPSQVPGTSPIGPAGSSPPPAKPAASSTPSMTKEEKQRAVVDGIVSLCIVGVAMSSSVAYLWWKWLKLGHLQDPAAEVPKS